MIAARIKARLSGGFDIADGLRDAVFLAGGAAIVFGVHYLSIAAAWIVGGGLAMYLSFASAPQVEIEQVEQPDVPQTAGARRAAA